MAPKSMAAGRRVNSCRFITINSVFRPGQRQNPAVETQLRSRDRRSMAEQAATYDFAVIGSGVSGGRLAYELTASGAKGVLLEAGREYGGVGSGVPPFP